MVIKFKPMSLKAILKTSAKRAKPFLEGIVGLETRVTRAWASAAHKRLYDVQWKLPPEPEHFEHDIDLYWEWRSSGNSLWVERGVYSSLALRKGARVLELCCGDGFYAGRFFSHRASSVTSVDFDPKAIATARASHARPNVEFRVADIRSAMPEGEFDNVVWDGAIEHFTKAEIHDLLAQIQLRLAPGGVLSGYTIVEREDGKSLSHHEYEFKSKEDLLGVLLLHFKNAYVFETLYPSRHNIYFWAGDGAIPFSKDWSPGVGKDSR